MNDKINKILDEIQEKLSELREFGIDVTEAEKAIYELSISE
jgi:hypothetical protein